MELIHNRCRQHLERTQDRMRQLYNGKRIESPTYNPGDQVWLLRRRQHDSTRPSAKLDYKRIGPLRVLEVVGSTNSAYRLKLPPGDQAHDVFSVVDLEPHKANRIPGREIPPPPPVIIGNQRLDEVEEILDSEIRYKKLRYKIWWTGYPRNEANFQEIKNPDDEVARLIREFHERYPRKPGPHNLAELLAQGERPKRSPRLRR